MDNTVCPRSSDPIYIVSYYIKWVTTSWTHSMYVNIFYWCQKSRGVWNIFFQNPPLILLSTECAWIAGNRSTIDLQNSGIKPRKFKLKYRYESFLGKKSNFHNVSGYAELKLHKNKIDISRMNYTLHLIADHSSPKIGKYFFLSPESWKKRKQIQIHR